MTHGLRPARLSIMCALALSSALRSKIAPDFEAATGIAADIAFEPTSVFQQRIAEGERADIIIATDEAIAELARRGVVIAATIEHLASAVLGVAIKAGAARPDVSTVEHFKQALTSARSVAYSRGGASGIYFAGLIRSLGIAEAVNARATVIPAGFTAVEVADGRADLAIQQISELQTVAGVEIAGPFPDEVQVATPFSAAVFTQAGDIAAAGSFVAALTMRAATTAYRHSGLVPHHAPANA